MVGILTYKGDITGHVTKRNEKKVSANLELAMKRASTKIHRSRTNKYVIRVHLYKKSG